MKPSRAVTVLVVLASVAGALAAARPASSPQTRKLKVHISVDMEGVAGTVTADQLGPTGFEYGRFREFMTREALAAVDAARAGGATEILVADAHGNGENLLVEQFPPDVRLIRSMPATMPSLRAWPSTASMSPKGRGTRRSRGSSTCRSS